MWGRTFAALGINYKGSVMTLDLCDRQGKYSNGFCHWPQVGLHIVCVWDVVWRGEGGDEEREGGGPLQPTGQVAATGHSVAGAGFCERPVFAGCLCGQCEPAFGISTKTYLLAHETCQSASRAQDVARFCLQCTEHWSPCSLTASTLPPSPLRPFLPPSQHTACVASP